MFAYYIYQGVDTSIIGEGGPKCVAYLSLNRRIIETIIYSLIALMMIAKYFYQLKLPFRNRYLTTLSSKQKALLALHSICFGIEIGYKLATRSIIFLANPCHLLTLLQCILLSVPPSPLVTAAYRIHLHMLNGPVIALFFPILESRTLPFQSLVYFFQHILIIIVPAVMMKPNSTFSIESLNDFSWVLVSLSIQILYHFLILQPLGLLTGINLNLMICPGSTDPFAGPNYRIFAMVHQPLAVLLIGKVYSIVIPKCKPYRLISSKCNKSNTLSCVCSSSELKHAVFSEEINQIYHVHHIQRNLKTISEKISDDCSDLTEELVKDHFNCNDLFCNQNAIIVPAFQPMCNTKVHDSNSTLKIAIDKSL